MNRRTFLKTGAAVGAAAVGASAVGGTGTASASGPASTRANETPKPVAGRRASPLLLPSLAAYSFRKELQAGSMSLEGFVDLCAAHDLPGVELTSYYFKDTSAKYLASLRRRAYLNGLTISGTPVGNDFCHPPGAERTKQLAHVKTWIDNVARLGSQTIRVFAGRVRNGQSLADGQKLAIEGMREVADYAGERGVILALENHGGITATADQLLALVRGVDSPWLGVNLDTGNFHGPDPYSELEQVAPWAVSVQVKVEVRAAGKPHEATDYGRIASILRGANYRGFVALEYEAKEPALEAVPKHLAALRAALAS